MVYRRVVPTVLCVLAVMPASASASFPADGKLWRQVAEAVGVTPADVATLCPRDGVSRCAGAYSGWIWATDAQVIALMGAYSPDLLSADPPAVGGADHLFAAISFLGDVRPTFFFSGYVDTSASASGWPAPGHAAGASYPYPYFNGSFGVGPAADEASRFRGAWLWRPADDDLTPPAVSASVDGTAGANGWYVSDVTVGWSVSDPESS